MTPPSSERVTQAEALFAAGQLAFERGNYRQSVEALEAGISLAGDSTLLGGTIQLWLMNAYSAAGRQADAIALGKSLAQHPDRDVRKQSQRVLEILQAPQLRRREEWLTPVPDLSNLEAGETNVVNRYNPPKKEVAIARPAPQPEDLSTINTRDNGFLWMALFGILVALGGLWWLRG